MDINVIAVDPGKITGIAWYDGRHFGSTQKSEEEITSYLAGLIEQRLHCIGQLHIVCERFDITTQTGRKTSQPAAVNIIGDIRATCRRKRVGLTMQPASLAKKIGSKGVLRKLGWWDTRSAQTGNHANDGASHVCLYLHNVHPAVWLDMLGSV